MPRRKTETQKAEEAKRKEETNRVINQKNQIDPNGARISHYL